MKLNKERYIMFYYQIEGGAKVGGYTFLNSKGEIDFTTSKEKLDLLTEQEIRAIDARYWSFAVKMEEENKKLSSSH